MPLLDSNCTNIGPLVTQAGQASQEIWKAGASILDEFTLRLEVDNQLSDAQETRFIAGLKQFLQHNDWVYDHHVTLSHEVRGDTAFLLAKITRTRARRRAHT